MRVIHRVFGLPCHEQRIGYRGEVSATELVIDVSAVVRSNPCAVYGIVVQRGNSSPYPIAGMLSPTAGKIAWTVDPYVTSETGMVAISVQAYESSVVVKSCAWKFYVTELFPYDYRDCPSVCGGEDYIFRQKTPSDTWGITHGLCQRTVSVRCYNQSGDLIIGDVEFIDKDSLRVTFSESVSGRAIINR